MVNISLSSNSAVKLIDQLLLRVRENHEKISADNRGLSISLLACSADRNADMPAISQSKLTKVIDWPNLDQGAMLKAPTAIAVDSHNHVFVFHRAGRPRVNPLPKIAIPDDTILMLDGETGRLLNSWGANRFIMPHGLSIDAEDNIWTTDVGSHQVQKFTHEGERLESFGEFYVEGDDQTHFGQPTDVAFLDGDIYISDGYTNTRILVMSEDGGYRFEWGQKGSGNSDFNLPHGVNIGRNGEVFIADRNNSRLQIFSRNGDFLEAWNSEKVGRPLAVDVASNGDIFIVDGGNKPDMTQVRILQFSRDGILIDQIDASHEEIPPLGHDIDVAPDGSIYVVDAWANRISKFVAKRNK